MTKIAIDTSSYLWRALKAGKDRENGREVDYHDKKAWINSAGYGVDICIGMIVELLKHYGEVPKNLIFAVEGMNSKSKRVLISNLYKAKREDKPAEEYVEFEEARTQIIRTFKDLGATIMTQDYAEGDDTLGWLAENTEENLVIATFDGDLTVLNGVNQYGAEVETYINGLTGVNKYGTFDYKYVTVYKALVGDTSDNISGCPGFGPAKFQALLDKYGDDTLEELHELMLQGNFGTFHKIEDCKLVKMLCQNEAVIMTSFELAKIRPEWVNTMRHPLRIEGGMTMPLPEHPDLRLKPWYGRKRLVTADNFDDAVAWAAKLIAESEDVTLDVETSNCEESDLWLERQGNSDGVDTLGSTLTGLGLTFGDNNQYSLYFSVDHADTKNVDKDKLADFLASISKSCVIHNTFFELPMLFMEFGERWKDNGFHGFLPNVLDTLYESSYVNENIALGLKFRSLTHLDYKQVEYDEVTTVSGHPASLPKGGKLLCEEEDEEGNITSQSRKYKMNELSGKHVLDYGLDDTICTAALHNYCKLVMQLEHTYQVYLDVEIDAAYLHAKSFVDGTCVSLEKMNELAAEDTVTHDRAWAVVRRWLIQEGWEGTICPVYGSDIAPAQIKEAYQIVVGEKLDTMIRTNSKLVTYIREVSEKPLFAGVLEELLADKPEAFNDMVRRYFKGEPESPVGSTTKMTYLMYEKMKLPVRVVNKVTDAARARGERKGTPKTDSLAIAYALQDASPEHKEVLEAMKLMKMVETRRSLYYDKYPGFVHWKTGKVHGSHRQCAANTRRATHARPNLAQMPKTAKVAGYEAKTREIIVPHRKDAVVVSMDFESQEMVIIGEWSQDPELIACFVGENKRNMHSLTGLGIVRRQQGLDWSYDDFVAALKSDDPISAKIAKEGRTLGKKVNFTVEFGAMADKVAQTLMVSKDTAQIFIDAREEMFPRIAEWKLEVIKEAKNKGYVKTLKGGVRHLREALMGGDKWIANKAERQSINFKVQGSAAEQTKCAEGRMWKSGLFFDFDADYLGVVHDETLASVLIKDLPEFLPRMHACMVAGYGNMKLPIVSTISLGKDFYNQIEIGSQPTPEAISFGVAELCKVE